MKMLAVAAIGLGAPTVASCTVGKGEGSVHGSLQVTGCAGKDLSSYDMGADFFGGLATDNQLVIRIQQGGGIQEYADSLTIGIQDTNEVEQNLGVPLPVALERPPGSAPNVRPPLIQATLSLRATCGARKLAPGDDPAVVLHAVRGTVTFSYILHGDVQSRDTNSKRIEGVFDLDVEDPRGWGTAGVSTGHISGFFKFFYQRGGPAQPFP